MGGEVPTDQAGEAGAALLARQALGSPKGRELAARAVRGTLRRGLAQRAFVREVGAMIYRLGGPKELRRMAETAERDGGELGRLAHDELLSGFWQAS